MKHKTASLSYIFFST